MNAAEVRRGLADRAIDRASKWTPFFVTNLPDPEKLQELALLGAHSYSLIQTRRRLIKKNTTIEIEEGVRETPSAIARDYLRMIYKHGPRTTKRQLDTTSKCPPVPNVAKPQKFAHGFYIDIVACYWSIMQIVGWNVDYNPGLWLMQGRAPYDFPFKDHKVARNCLPSAGRTDGIPRYNPKKLPGDPYDEVRPGNNLKNLQLPRLIHDVLNCIAVEVLDAGAIYINNDGLIAPTPGIAKTCEGIVADWGLKTKVKAQGSGTVKASGTYRVGMVETMTYQYVKDQQPIERVYPFPYAGWLKKEFTFFASQGGSK